MLEDRVELVELFEAGARIYVCGSTGVGGAVKDACKEMYIERRAVKIAELKEKGETPVDAELGDEEAAETFFDRLRTAERYATDVFT
jgi:cytochrome P450/NADPH-cytochrome P450 reductase